MIETQEDIDFLLEDAGENLVFLEFTIKGIPGIDEYMLSSNGSSLDIIGKAYEFIISTKDFLTKAITVGNNFHYANSSYNYLFSIKSYISDLSGTHKLLVELVSVTNV